MEDVDEETDITFLVPHSDASSLTAMVSLFLCRMTTLNLNLHS